MTEDTRLTPQQAWDELVAGNTRFTTEDAIHPHQDAARRRSLKAGQHPIAVTFGCSDSRPAHELVFDEGLGDVFVVRNAGHVINPSSVGSIEYGVGPLDVPLLVVMGHESCGAVRAGIDSTRPDAPELPPAIWRLIAPITPTAQRVIREEHATADTVDALHVGREHVNATIDELIQASPMTAQALEAGRLGIVGCVYMLAEGTVVPHTVRGPITIPGL